MGIFSKKKEVKKSGKEAGFHGLPELPKLPEFPQLPEIPEFKTKEAEQQRSTIPNMNILPSFPNSEMGNKMSNETVKDIFKKDFKEKFGFPEEQGTAEIDKQEKEPLFVRVDKYRISLENFHDIKRRVSEISKTLEGIREVRNKQEMEFKKWESEIQQVKEKLNKIDKLLFQRLE